VVAQAAFTGMSVLFVDAAGQPAAVYLEGQRAYVRVVAPLAGLPDLSVTLSAELSGDSESLLLNQTSPGVYEGSIDTELSAGAVPGNDVIELSEAAGPPHEFETLTATFAFSNDTATASVGFTGSRTWFIDAYGAVTEAFPLGSPIFVRVEDHRFEDPAQFDRVLVQVRSLATGDVETLELLETTKTSRLYEGSLGQRDYSVAIPGDGVLQVELGTLIEAGHEDTLGWTTSQAQALIDYSGIEFIDQEGEPTAVVLEEGTARVRVVRISNYDDSGSVETLTIDLTSRYAGDQESLALTETGPDTGVYEGSIQLDLGSAEPGDGTLQTFNSGAPEYLGDELAASYGMRPATAVTVSSRVVCRPSSIRCR
jgi:hypothetical protein